MRDWRDQLTGALIKTQGTNGSWQNPAGEMRENDPLVATSFALLALA